MSQRVLTKITSKYIIRTIFDYIKDKNFSYKLFLYSKSFQQKINIELYDYQILYLIKNDINLEEYLTYNDYNETNDYFDKNIIKRNLNFDLSYNNIDININKEIIIKYFNLYLNSFNKKANDDNEKYYKYPELFIDIFSPFFNILSRDKTFENFSINILLNDIEKTNLALDYISTFENLNKSKSKYISIKLQFINDYEFDIFKHFKIKSEQIKRLTILNKTTYKCNCFNNYFPILTNLVYLNITNKQYLKIDINSLLYINKLKSLEQLVLNQISLNDNRFILELYNLKLLSIYSCQNIIINKKTALNIKKLYLINCIIDNNILNDIVVFPSLEECEIDSFDQIDLSESKKLNILKISKSGFLKIRNLYVEKLIFKEPHRFTDDDEKKILEKLCTLKSLKIIINLILLNITNYDIIKIKSKNLTVTHLNIVMNNNNNKCIIYSLQNIFPNISNLEIESNYSKDEKIYFKDIEKSRGINLNIIENQNYKIQNISIKSGLNQSIELFCSPYKNLIKVDLELLDKINKIEDSFPFFNSNCKVIFENLKYFRLKNNEITYKILKNIYNNIECMPNLKYLELYCTVKNVFLEFYNDFIKKMLSLHLDKLYITIKYWKPQRNKIHFRINEEYLENGENTENISDQELNDDYDNEDDNEIEEEEEESENEEYTKKELNEICPIINCRQFIIRKFLRKTNNCRIFDFFKIENFK